MTGIDMDELIEELLQCRRCGICRNSVYEAKGFDGICPIWRNSSGFETDFMRGKIMVALALIDGRLEKTAENAESLFRCTLCGNCTEICAAEFNPVEIMETVRQVLGDLSNEVRDSLAKKILQNDTPYDVPASSKRDWVKELGFEVPSRGDVVYYVGCTAGAKLPPVAKATAKILHAAGVEFAVMEDEPCCGSVMLRTGKVEEVAEYAKEAVEAIARTGAKQIIISCAGCLKTLRNDYPAKFNLEMPEILHIVEYAEQLIKDGKIKPRGLGETQKVTYHDPCHMGRELDVYDAPRFILESLPDLELVEMETIRAQAICCGAGGGLRSYDAALSKDIGADRVRSAESTGAQILATACPFCEINLVSGTEIQESSMRVADVVELLAEGL